MKTREQLLDAIKNAEIAIDIAQCDMDVAKSELKSMDQRDVMLDRIEFALECILEEPYADNLLARRKSLDHHIQQLLSTESSERLSQALAMYKRLNLEMIAAICSSNR